MSKPITVHLSIADSLLITTGLTHIIENNNYHELDRELADKLRKEIIQETNKIKIIERSD